MEFSMVTTTKRADNTLHLPNQDEMMRLADPPEEVLPAEVAFLLLVQSNKPAVDSSLTQREQSC